MSTQPGDPSPQDPAPHRDDGRTATPPPGFFRQAAALFANRNAKILLAIVLVLLVILAIAMVSSVGSTSKGPATGALHVPALLGLAGPGGG